MNETGGTEMEKTNKSEKVRRSDGIITQIVFAALSIVIGGALTFVQSVDTQILCIIFCVMLIISGVGYAAVFFISGGHKRLYDYRLSLGILLFILGCCGVFKAEALAGAFPIFAGVVTLMLGTMLLQSTIQLTVVGSRANILVFVFSILVLAASVISLTGFAPIMNTVEIFPQLSLMISGVFDLVSFILTAIVLRKARRQEEKQKAEAENKNDDTLEDEPEAKPKESENQQQ